MLLILLDFMKTTACFYSLWKYFSLIVFTPEATLFFLIYGVHLDVVAFYLNRDISRILISCILYLELLNCHLLLKAFVITSLATLT